MTLQERYLQLGEEYNDLIEEFNDCGDHEERCRCAVRMSQICQTLEEMNLGTEVHTCTESQAAQWEPESMAS